MFKCHCDPLPICVLGMVSAMDEGIANITNAYKTNGLWDDTIVIFSTGEVMVMVGFYLRLHPDFML